jgi:hypothetical protein
LALKQLLGDLTLANPLQRLQHRLVLSEASKLEQRLRRTLFSRLQALEQRQLLEELHHLEPRHLLVSLQIQGFSHLLQAFNLPQLHLQGFLHQADSSLLEEHLGPSQGNKRLVLILLVLRLLVLLPNPHYLPQQHLVQVSLHPQAYLVRQRQELLLDNRRKGLLIRSERLKVALRRLKQAL